MMKTCWARLCGISTLTRRSSSCWPTFLSLSLSIQAHSSTNSCSSHPPSLPPSPVGSQHHYLPSFFSPVSSQHHYPVILLYLCQHHSGHTVSPGVTGLEQGLALKHRETQKHRDTHRNTWRQRYRHVKKEDDTRYVSMQPSITMKATEHKPAIVTRYLFGIPFNKALFTILLSTRSKQKVKTVQWLSSPRQSWLSLSLLLCITARHNKHTANSTRHTTCLPHQRI